MAPSGNGRPARTVGHAILCLALGLIVAGCASSTGADGSPATDASAMPASPAASPTAAPTPVPTVTPTPSPSLIPGASAIASCEVSDAGQAGGVGTGTRKERAENLPPELKAIPVGTSIYGLASSGGLWVAPTGWTCTMEIAGNGGILLSITAAAPAFGRITILEGSQSFANARYIACPWFPNAAGQLYGVGTDTCEPVPAGFEVTPINSNLVRYRGPVIDEAAPAGAADVGIVWFIPPADAAGLAAMSIDCQVPAEELATCARLVLQEEPLIAP